jgi:hypothetical protein
VRLFLSDCVFHNQHSFHVLILLHLVHIGEVDMSTFTVVPRTRLIADMGDAKVRCFKRWEFVLRYLMSSNCVFCLTTVYTFKNENWSLI